ncbi:hypothetical protein OL229_19735 [Neisseriaceae bacterium JH1-16]|nr:hypothetical protein [Neisseriaceae bacterium JH1-16]
MKKLLLITLTTVFGLISAASFAAEASSAMQAPTPKVQTKPPAKSATIHKGHLKKKTASKPAAMQKAQSAPYYHHGHHHHRHHKHHRPM